MITLTKAYGTRSWSPEQPSQSACCSSLDHHWPKTKQDQTCDWLKVDRDSLALAEDHLDESTSHSPLSQILEARKARDRSRPARMRCSSRPEWGYFPWGATSKAGTVASHSQVTTTRRRIHDRSSQLKVYVRRCTTSRGYRYDGEIQRRQSVRIHLLLLDQLIIRRRTLVLHSAPPLAFCLCPELIFLPRLS